MRKKQTLYDLIGDLHGEASKLRLMLDLLGYRHVRGAYRHPRGRKVVFVGDLIDRGPAQIEVFQIVRDMVYAGSAHCVMGNHEYNAIGYMTLAEGSSDKYLFERSRKGVLNHTEFLRQVGEASALHLEMIEFFKRLPVALDLGGVRVVHAWWHQPYVDLVSRQTLPGEPMPNAFLQKAFVKGTPENRAMEGLTKGLELFIPEGTKFKDDAGGKRKHLRIKWWERKKLSYREAFMPPDGVWENADVLEQDVPEHLWIGHTEKHEVPLFIGHYWMSGHPVALTPTIACLDYSVAKKGPLVGYRWHGESILQPENFVSV